MKEIKKTKFAGAASAALLATVALSPLANAQLNLVYENGPLTGQVFNGTYSIKLQGYDMGTLYSLPPGTSGGFGQGGSSADVASGISYLDANKAVGATGAVGASEDSWGIAEITSITDAVSGATVWSPAVKGERVSIMFYGVTDFYVNQTNADTFTANSTSLHADFYLQDSSWVLPVASGAAGRTTASTYTGVTNANLLLSTVSTAGFINSAGIAGGTDAEFASLFNQASKSGEGVSYLSITGGSEAARFNTNSYASSTIPGNTADMFASFTTRPPLTSNPGGWLVRVNDPIEGDVFTPVPEPSTYGLMAAGALAAVVALRRRNQKKA